MSQADAISIGSKVRVTRVRDRIPQAMVDLLKKDANGTVTPFVLRVARPRFDLARGHHFRIDCPYFRRKWY